MQAGDTVLDLACGQGNFTVEWAKRVGPQGLVIGLDISSALLERAVYHVNRGGLDNVLLIRDDAHQLPSADDILHRVNCSGDFHQFPDYGWSLPGGWFGYTSARKNAARGETRKDRR